MIIKNNFKQRSDEWHEARQGKITGTGLKKIVGTKASKEEYFYELLAERLSTDSNDEESALDRGVRLENEAKEAFEAETGKMVEEVGILLSDENNNLACSPDGIIKNGSVYDEAVEIKCLSSKNHIKAILENSVPKEYYAQAVQYFIVNENLKKLYFVLYDPRVSIKPIHVIDLFREQVEEDIQNYKSESIEMLSRVDKAVAELIEF